MLIHKPHISTGGGHVTSPLATASTTMSGSQPLVPVPHATRDRFVSVIEGTKDLSISEEKHRSPKHCSPAAPAAGGMGVGGPLGGPTPAEILNRRRQSASSANLEHSQSGNLPHGLRYGQQCYFYAK